MDFHTNSPEQHTFEANIAVKYQLYNSLFSSLPFHRIEKTGLLLSVLGSECEEGYQKLLSPTEIIHSFLKTHTTYEDEQDQIGLLFRFIQYVERQVVLFDALEDAGFTKVKDIDGAGSIKQLKLDIQKSKKEIQLAHKLRDFSIYLVLTAHPTQFYPGAVLGIIHDLATSVAVNDVENIKTYLEQLGKTPFLQKKQPTPYDEAVSLIWYLENVFYDASGNIANQLIQSFGEIEGDHKPLIKLGFWPGSDRDGNPFVTTQITQNVAKALRQSIIKCYYRHVRMIKRRLTFSGVDILLSNLENLLYSHIHHVDNTIPLTADDIRIQLDEIKSLIDKDHDGLFGHLVTDLIRKVQLFGLHFATLDIRQESVVHHQVLDAMFTEYTGLSVSEKLQFLSNPPQVEDNIDYPNALTSDTILNIKGVETIHLLNGELGCNRYIISQCQSALNVMEVYGLFLACGWDASKLNMDIVPLFETIDDLQNAASVMIELYQLDTYRQHIKSRGNKQTIMLGFSDGTKDGGYLMANYSIYKAKVMLTKVSNDWGVDVMFFDGRGGPPSRGGGKTHQFYASMGRDISNNEIQLTIQGQTISSNFGTVESAQYNMEQLINAGVTSDLFSEKDITLSSAEDALFVQLGQQSYDTYSSLKNHPDFMAYLSDVSPLKYYTETNIASRPAKRNAGTKLTLRDLRAIPYVGAWSQLKQNITGYYGVGTALAALDEEGRFHEAKALYERSLYFKTLMDNSEMAMKKCFFPLTAYLGNDSEYAEIWHLIHAEYELSKKYILLLSGRTSLMGDHPIDSLSIELREKIVRPLLTIQQYALQKIRKMSDAPENDEVVKSYKKLVIRSSFGIINAGRNSV